MSNGLDPDQDQCSVSLNQCLNCLKDIQQMKKFLLVWKELNTVKPVLSDHSKIDKTKGLKDEW